MKRPTCWLIGLLLIAPVFNLSSPAQNRGRRQTSTAASPARPGFYIQFEIVRAAQYGNWQRDIISALGRVGVQGFVSDDISSHYTEQSYWTLRDLRLRRPGAEGMTASGMSLPVYAGPFETEQSARQVSSQLPSILNPIFDKIDRGMAAPGDTTTYFSRRFENCTGNQCSLHALLIQLVRVQPSTTTARGQSGQLSSATQNWGIFWNAFRAALRSRDRTALIGMMPNPFLCGGAVCSPSEWIEDIDRLNLWRRLQRSADSGIMPPRSNERNRRYTNDGIISFELGADGRWRWVEVTEGIWPTSR